MSDTGKWKSKLLSSSVPMEYAVAKTLVESGFAIDNDYAYSRDEANITKDFSVDIKATGYLPFKADNIRATIDLLIECKHRHRSNKWLFFPDPNEGGMSPFTLGRTIRVVDNFSRAFFAPNCTVPFDKKATFCMKGVEIDTSSGSVHDSELRHGLAQLQYALPRLLSDNITFNTYGHEEDNHPFIFCPILLTTSDLFVAHEDISMDAVEQATTLEDIAVPASYVVVYLDSTPDFNRHRRDSCSSLAELATWLSHTDLDTFRKKRGEYDFLLPSKLCHRLAQSNEEKFTEYFSQAVVCSLKSFPELIKKIKRVATKTVKTMNV